ISEDRVRVAGGGFRQPHYRRKRSPGCASAGVDCAPELLAAPMVLGVGECSACRKYPVSRVASQETTTPCGKVSGSGGTLRCSAPPAKPAFGRHATACGDRARVCDSAIHLVPR